MKMRFDGIPIGEFYFSSYKMSIYQKIEELKGKFIKDIQENQYGALDIYNYLPDEQREVLTEEEKAQYL